MPVNITTRTSGIGSFEMLEQLEAVFLREADVEHDDIDRVRSEA